MRLGAEQLPYLRRELVAFERSMPGELWRRHHYQSGLLSNFTTAMSEDDYVAVTQAELATVPLYHVTEDMSRVCLAAAEQLGRVDRVTAEDFPSPKGMIFWSGLNVATGEDSDACAVRWSHAATFGGGDASLCVLVWYYNRERRPDLIPAEATLVPRIVSYPDALWEFGEWDEEQTVADIPICDRLLLATCLLMNQYVSRTERVPQQRHSRKADERAKIEPKPVTVIALRRVHGEGASSGDGEGRDYSHRWIVGGHWRNQWYPSREVHRPVWIAPYVKGPDDKPLVLKERVTSLMR